MNKTERLELRLSTIQMESLKKQATKKGMNASELIRYWIESKKGAKK